MSQRSSVVWHWTREHVTVGGTIQDNLKMTQNLKDNHKITVDKHKMVKPTSQHSSEPGEFAFSHDLGNRTLLRFVNLAYPYNTNQHLWQLLG